MLSMAMSKPAISVNHRDRTAKCRVTLLGRSGETSEATKKVALPLAGWFSDFEAVVPAQVALVLIQYLREVQNPLRELRAHQRHLYVVFPWEPTLVGSLWSIMYPLRPAHWVGYNQRGEDKTRFGNGDQISGDCRAQSEERLLGYLRVCLCG